MRPSMLSKIVVFLALPFAACAEDGTVITPVRGDISMIVSPMGGNVVVSAGEDGTFIIDDQLVDRSAIIAETVSRISNKPVKFIVNTHYHFDHTGGNEHFGSKETVIVAHDNVRKRLSTKQFITFFNKEQPPLSKAGLPVVTFGNDITFHYNNDDIHIIHVPNAHTDGDVIAHFAAKNVIIAGDVVFNGMYPFIDVEHGGSAKGMIAAMDKILTITNAETIIVPGHGGLMKREELKAYRDALATLAGRVEALIKADKTLEQAVAEKPTSDFDARMGGGMINPDAFVKILYESLRK